MREPITVDNAAKLASIGTVKSGWITQVAWSPDGMTTAVAGADSVRLYVGKFGGEPTHILAGHEGHVKGMAFTPNSQYIATIASDTTVKLWDARDIQNEVTEIQTLKAHKDSIDGIAFNPNGESMATCSADGTIHLWDLETLKVSGLLEGHDAEVSCISYALDGNLLVSGSWDCTVRLWDAQNETQGTVLGYHDDWVRQVTANPPGTMIASASKDGTVRLWDAHSGEAYANIYAHENGADCVAFSTDGSLIATGGRDNVVRLWDTNEMLAMGRTELEHALAELKIHDKPVLSLAFNPAGTLLATGSGDNTVHLWAVE